MDSYLTVEASITPDTSAYSAADVVGGLITFEGAGGVAGGGILNSIMLADDDNEKAGLTLYLFDEVPATIADQAAFALSLADAKKLVAAVVWTATTDYTSVGTQAYSYKGDLNYTFTSDGKNRLYGYLVATVTPTYASSKTLHLQLRILTQG